MPTPTKGPRLGGSPAHERLMLANLATSLFKHGRIQTTETKAKRLRPLAEQLITKAKRGDLHARRQALSVVRDKDVVFQLFDQIAQSGCLSSTYRWAFSMLARPCTPWVSATGVSTRAMLAPGAIACAHSTSSDVS